MQKFIIPILILISTFVLRFIITKIFNIILKKKNKIHIKFLKSIIQFLIVFAGIIAILLQFDITKSMVNSLVTSSTLIVAVLTFSAQQSLNDIISGVMISYSNKYEIGERITIYSDKILTGTVESMTITHTTIRTPENKLNMVPNHKMCAAILENTDRAEPVNFIEIPLSYSLTKDQIILAMDIIKKEVEEHPLTDKEDEVVVTLARYENNLILKTNVKTGTIAENFKACSDIRINIKDTLSKNGIELAYSGIKLTTNNANEYEVFGKN